MRPARATCGSRPGCGPPCRAPPPRPHSPPRPVPGRPRPPRRPALRGASMHGLPPLLGFVGKEAAFAGFLDEGGLRGWIVALGLVLGSTPTAAASARFLWGAFAREPGVDPRGASAAAPYPHVSGSHLALCHGLGLPLLFTAVALGGGLVLHAQRD